MIIWILIYGHRAKDLSHFGSRKPQIKTQDQVPAFQFGTNAYMYMNPERPPGR